MKKLKCFFNQKWVNDLFEEVAVSFNMLFFLPLAIRYAFLAYSSVMVFPDWSIEFVCAGLFMPAVVQDVITIYRSKDKECIKDA